MEFYIVFSYFDKIIGPTVFYTYPKKRLNEKEASIVANLMDQMISEGFFTYSFNGCNTLNYYFEIDSDTFFELFSSKHELTEYHRIYYYYRAVSTKGAVILLLYLY